MNPGLLQAHSNLEDVLASGVDICTGMTRLAEYCRSVYPDESWSVVPEGPIVDDLWRLQQWFVDVLTSEPPGSHIVALWYGLYRTEFGYRLYLAGTTSFDPDDPTAEWAVGPAYWPRKRHAPPTTFLQSLPRRLARHDRAAAGLGEYVLALGYAALAMEHVVATVDSALVAGHAGSRGIAVGYDDGDFLILGTVTRDGLMNVK